MFILKSILKYFNPLENDIFQNSRFNFVPTEQESSSSYQYERQSYNLQKNSIINLDIKQHLYISIAMAIFMIYDHLLVQITSLEQRLMFCCLVICKFFFVKKKQLTILNFLSLLQWIALQISFYFSIKSSLSLILLLVIIPILSDTLPLNIILLMSGLNVIFLAKAYFKTMNLLDIRQYNSIHEMIVNYYFNSFGSILIIMFICTYLKFRSRIIIGDFNYALNSIKADGLKKAELLTKMEASIKNIENIKNSLEEALKTKDQMLATVSHDLRNPLNSLLGHIELLGAELTTEKHKEMIDIARICGEILLSLINNLLDGAKIASGHLELSMGITNFYEFLEKLWKIHSLKIKQKQLIGELYVSKNFPCKLVIDSQRMMQILINLIGNSTKFTDHGYIRCYFTWYNSGIITDDMRAPKMWRGDISTYGPIKESNYGDSEVNSYEENPNQNCFHVEVASEKSILDSVIQSQTTFFNPKFIKDIIPEGYIQFSVQDLKINETLVRFSQRSVLFKSNLKNTNQCKKGIMKFEILDSGCGISKEGQQRLFHPFCQESAAITKRYGGTGLGLYIIKQIVSRMGGEIYLYSDKGIGSDFAVLIPCEIPEDILSPPLDSTPLEKRFLNTKLAIKKYDGHKALIVEDNPYNQKVMQSFLESMNIQVDIAGTAAEALEKFKIKEINYYSFITMDLNLPDADGTILAKNIRNLERQKKAKNHISIVLISGDSLESQRIACLDPKGDIRASFLYRKPLNFADCQAFVKAIITKIHKIKKCNILLLAIENSVPSTLLNQEDSTFQINISQTFAEIFEKLKDPASVYDCLILDCEIDNIALYTYLPKIRDLLKSYNKENMPIIGMINSKTSDIKKSEYFKLGFNHIVEGYNINAIREFLLK